MISNRAGKQIVNLTRAPIVEAILDIDCDMPSLFDLNEITGTAAKIYADDYPVQRQRHFMAHTFKNEGTDDPQLSMQSVEEGLEALQFLKSDGKQLVQLRRGGFSFNRLAPYSSLDDYLGEISKAWGDYITLVKPQVIRSIRLRYVNRIPVPLQNDKCDLDDYLQLGPRVPDGGRLSFSGFMRRDEIFDTTTKHQAVVLLASETPVDSRCPIILDIMTLSNHVPDSLEWKEIEQVVQSLRELKNFIFESTLTQKCLELFQ